MKSFFINIAAGLVLMYLIGNIIVPWLDQKLTDDQTYIDVSTEIVPIGSYCLTKVSIKNNSKKAFDPISFSPISSGKIILVGVNLKGAEPINYAVDIPTKIWEGKLTVNQEIIFSIISKDGKLSTEMEKQISGNYIFLDSKGLPDKGILKIRTESERQIYLMKYIGMWCLIVGVVTGVCMLIFYLTNKKRKTAIEGKQEG